MAMTIGFGDSEGSSPGFLTGGLAALLSPNREAGFMGGMRAFLNPGPTLAQDAAQQAGAALNAVTQATMPAQQEMWNALDAGDRAHATDLLLPIMAEYEKHGINPEEIQKKFIFKAHQNDVAGVRQVDPRQPDALSQYGKFVDTPEQGATLGRTDVLNQGTRADIARTEQQTSQAGQLFPGQLSMQGAQLETERAQPGEIAARTGLLGVQTEKERRVTDIIKDTGMYPSTPSTAAARGRMVSTVDTTGALTGDKGAPVTIDESTGAVYPRYEDPNARLFRQGMNKGEATGTTLPPPTPSEAPAGGTPRRPLSAQDIPPGDISKMGDEEIGTVHFAQETLTDQQRQRVAQLRKELQTILAQTPDERQRRKVFAEYSRRVLHEVAGVPNAVNQ